MAKPAPPASMKCRTCAFDALEQLPETIAAVPDAGGSTAAPALGASPWFCGRPIATPEPATSNGRSAKARPIVIRSASAIASTIASETPSAFSAAMRARTASVPARTVRWSIRPMRAVAHWRCRTRTRFASVIGVSGWSRMPLSFNGTAPTNR